jgi:hypothetical protein
MGCVGAMPTMVDKHAIDNPYPVGDGDRISKRLRVKAGVAGIIQTS